MTPRRTADLFLHAFLRAIPVLLFSIAIYPVVAFAQWPPDGVALSTAANGQTNPMIISDGAGGAIMAWYDYRDNATTRADIYVRRIDSSGMPQWTADGVALCTAVRDQSFPTIASDGAGGAIVTWQDYRGGTTSDIYVQRIDASGVVQWTPNGVALCTAANEQAKPTIVSDGAGGAIVTWYDARTGGNDIYARRVDASGAVQWTADGVALCIAANDQWDPTIVSDGAGGAIVTWYDYRGGTTSNIFAQRIGASGTPQWTANGVALCTAVNYQVYPTIVSDGASGAIVTWFDYRDDATKREDIYVRRIDASGVPQWTADGVALCTAVREQRYPTIASDGAGGAIVTWFDFRSGDDDDVYAQRINAAGAVQWTANGVILCADVENQQWPTIVEDGAGGAIVTWYDYRTLANLADIYAQRIDASGATQWIGDGVALCTAAGDQYAPTIVSDGAAGGIVTWFDHRSGDADIYATRVLASGSIPTGVGAAPPVAALTALPNHPNPFSETTALEFVLPASSDVLVEIYDVAGRRVRTQRHAHQMAGRSAVPFDGRNDAGRSLAGGVYLYRITASGVTVNGKMVIAR